MTNDLALQEPQNYFDLIKQLSKASDVDPAKFSALLDIQQRLEDKQAEKEFNQALSRILKVIPRIPKNGIVEFDDKKGGMKKAYDFAKWEDIDAVIRPILDEEGFSLSFDSTPREGGGAVITGTLLHGGGHTRSASMPLPLDTSGGKGNLQGMGSTLSYGKRYTTSMLLNLVFEGQDDDGKRGDCRYIDDASVKMINSLLTETESDRNKFLQFMEAAEVENIQAKDLPKAINALMSKKAKK